jgi:hypothetical protein
MTFPSLFRAPGPTAITVASGRGEDVADVGRRIPAAVFWCPFVEFSTYSSPRGGRNEEKEVTGTYCVWLETLDEDAVKEGDDGLDRFDCGLGSLRKEEGRWFLGQLGHCG